MRAKSNPFFRILAGNAPALSDVVAGHIPAMFSNFSDALPQAKAGNVRMIALSSEKRSPLAPELPTVGAYFFEVPSDRLAGLRAEFYVGTQVPDVVVQVDLGLTGKTDAALNAGAAAEVVLQP